MAPASPVIVVGAGVAGLATALSLAPRPVLLACREADAGGSASALAQGGIAAALGAGDGPDAHARDTLVAGAGHNDVAMVHWLCAQAPSAIAWLQEQGVRFDHDGDRLRLAREGGHGRARVVHAGGDASGAVLMRALLARARDAAHVRWLAGEVDGLLLRDGAASGVRVRDAGGTHDLIDAACVVLASGGCGALYARTSNPGGADGAGLLLGLRAGARARDLEFMQFHPTALASGSAQGLPLVTEALRGAGARLRDGRGRPLMDGVHALGDLAPRDVVARRVAQVLRSGESAWLDARSLGGAWPARFPTVLGACRAQGIDPLAQPIPITPVAHFHMGGLEVDPEGATSVPGLYAVGEVACNGVHGANRLASNSLLEGVVCGRRLGHRLARLPMAGPRGGSVRVIERGSGVAPGGLASLRTRMWDCLGPERDGASMRAFARTLDPASGWQADLARRMLRAALGRRDSLGAHWRIDAPARQRRTS